jgi:hypothetical protein
MTKRMQHKTRDEHLAPPVVFAPSVDCEPPLDFEPPVDPLLAERLPDDALLAQGVFAGGYVPRLDSLLDDVAEDESALAMRAARRARSVERAREWAMVSDEFVLVDAPISASKRLEWVMRSFISELATRQQLSELMADRLVDESRILVTELPGTLEALECGLISYRHAQVIIEQAGTLPRAARAGFEEAVLVEAARLPVARFRKVAVKAREHLHPDSIAGRTRAATEERRLAFDADQDGMAWVSAYLPADRAQALFNRITAIAKSLQQGGETRTLPQLRADVACDLLLDGRVLDPDQANTGGPANTGGQANTSKRKGANWGIRPTVIVTVPLTTLIGTGEEPGNLDGYGPIDPATARRLAGLAPTFRRLLIDPVTGVALSLGRKRYKVTKDLRLWLQLRDEVCRFPGCNRPAIHSEIDHTDAFAFGGATDAGNLAALCRLHHRMKHLTTWKVDNRGNGILDWTSPTGKTHTTYPATTLPTPPQPPPPPEQLDEAPPF